MQQPQSNGIRDKQDIRPVETKHVTSQRPKRQIAERLLPKQAPIAQPEYSGSKESQ